MESHHIALVTAALNGPRTGLQLWQKSVHLKVSDSKVIFSVDARHGIDNQLHYSKWQTFLPKQQMRKFKSAS